MGILEDEMNAPLQKEKRHYLSAIRERLDQLYQEHPSDPRLREQIADEVDWIDEQIGEREWVLDR